MHKDFKLSLSKQIKWPIQLAVQLFRLASKIGHFCILY